MCYQNAVLPCVYESSRLIRRSCFKFQLIVGHHQGLELPYEKGNRRRVPQEKIEKIERILAHLDVASKSADLNLPGFRLHPLKGDLANYWAVNVSGNLRLVFRFEGTNARDVDLNDYH